MVPVGLTRGLALDRHRALQLGVRVHDDVQEVHAPVAKARRAEVPPGARLVGVVALTVWLPLRRAEEEVPVHVRRDRLDLGQVEVARAAATCGRPAVARDRLTQFAVAQGIPYIDFLEPFQNSPDSSGLYRDHIHLSPAGNRQVAAALTQTLYPLLKSTMESGPRDQG